MSDFQLSMEDIIQNLLLLDNDHQAQIAQYVEGRVPEIEEWLKSNAPWQDQTGDARRFLTAEVTTIANKVVLTMAHGVDYGVFLELSNAGKYEILTPALDYWGPIIFEEIRSMLDG